MKKRGQELAYRLRHMSRSMHRGGTHPNLGKQLAAAEAGEAPSATAARRAARGKRRQSRSAALEALTRSAALPVAEAARVPDLDLDRVLGGQLATLVEADAAAQAATERAAGAARTSGADGGSLYDAPAALAYAASRLPACYAALHRALCDVAGRRPGWRPTSQLDFGSGPGTAVWAAAAVWPQAALDVTAVEQAGAMAWLGGEIQQGQREQYEAAAARAAARLGGGGAGGAAAARAATGAAQRLAGDDDGEEEEGEEEEEEEVVPAPPPRLRWMYKLPPRYRAAQGKQYELVTAGYVLGELQGDAERRCVTGGGEGGGKARRG